MASLLVILPFLGLLLLNLPVGRAVLQRASTWVTFLILSLQVGLVLLAPRGAWEAVRDPLDAALGLGLAGDSLSLVLLLSVALVGLAALSVSLPTLPDGEARARFESVLLLVLAGMNGTVLVRDVFSLWVFIELVGVCSFVLIAWQRDAAGLGGAFKYLVLSGVASALMLGAIGLLFIAVGSTGYDAIQAAITAPGAYFPVGLAMALFVGGLLVKSGVVPFHGWLPDAYTAAPPAVSVLLAGIVTKTSGVYALVRLVAEVLGFSPAILQALLVTGALTVVVGAVVAMAQSDLKRMLSWSSISQVGYIVLALGTGTELGLAGATFHLFNHAIFKAQLFVNAAAVEASTGTRDMDRLGGLANRMPFTGGTSVVGFLSTAGVPPLAGFWSKLVIVLALWQAGHPVHAAIAVLASLVTLAYFLGLQRRVFFGVIREGLEQVQEAGVPFVVPAVAFALVNVGVGLFFYYLLDTFILPVRSILG